MLASVATLLACDGQRRGLAAADAMAALDQGSSDAGDSDTSGPDAAAAAVERCNGVDDDDDQAVDEGQVEVCGACGAGFRTCVAGAFGRCLFDGEPPRETCEAGDEDCDGREGEGPIIRAEAVLDAPAAGTPRAILWTGETWLLALGGYPSWLVAVSAEGPTVWGSTRFGRFNEPFTAARHPDGIALAWPGNDGRLHYAFLDEALRPVRPEGPLADLETTESVGLAADQPSVGLAWVDPAGDVRFVRVDADRGELRTTPVVLGAGRAPRVADYGDEGHVVSWRAPDGRLALARIDGLGAVAATHTTEVRSDAVSVQVNPYVDQVAVLTADDGVVGLHRFGRDLAPAGSGVTLERTGAEVTRVDLVRMESTYGVFWAGPELGLRGALIRYTGEVLSPPAALGPAAEAFAFGRGNFDFGVVALAGNELRLLVTPFGCDAPE